MGDFDFSTRALDFVHGVGASLEKLLDTASDELSQQITVNPDSPDCYVTRKWFPWEIQRCTAPLDSADPVEADDDIEPADDELPEENILDRFYHGASDTLERGYEFFWNGAGKPYNPMVLENWDRMPFLGIKLFLCTALGGGDYGPSAKVDDQDFSIHAKKGALVINGQAWRLRGNSLKIRMGSEIEVQEAHYIPGEGLRLKVTVKVPEMFIDKVPESLRANVNNPDNPIDRVIPEDQLGPILKALASGEDHPVIPQLQGYPLEVVRG